MSTSTPVDTIMIDTSADYAYLYAGLSRQSIDFHQAIAELIDNAISAKLGDYFTIEILLESQGDNVEVTVADNGRGISKEDIESRVLKLGGRGKSPGVLNEHGFGLKNSLCVLTGNRLPFKIITADKEIVGKGDQWVIHGPFQQNMRASLARDQQWERNITQCRMETGTRVIATATRDYLRTVYPRATRLETLAIRLAEHLGVFYRGWLANDARNQIWLRWNDGSSDWQEIVVPPIKLPISDEHQSFSIEVEVNGKKASARYITGTLDERKLQGDQRLFPLQYYYQRNERTQGVDVVVRNKVILTHQLEQLWPDQIRRRERNQFLGELILKGNAFSTVNNKTDLDPHGPFWIKVREQLQDRADLLPPSYALGRDEAAIRDNLKDILENFESGSHAQKNYPVWAGTGVRADIVHEGPDNEWLDVYELKDQAASPQDVYQLIMYWDGLVNDGKTPRRGRLVAEEASDSVLNLLKHWNKRRDLQNNQYNVEFKNISDLGMRIVRTGTRAKTSRRRRN